MAKEKYFYSKEEDKIIVDFVNNDFLKKQADRRPFELIWELNMNFYIGNQYSYINPSGIISDIEKNYIWENHEVYNHIAPIIESRLSKLGQSKPNIQVKSSNNTDSDIYKSKLAKAIISSSFNETNLSTLINTATHWSEITGTAFYKISWNNASNFKNTKLKNDGDVEISVCTPFEIYPDSNFTQDINDCSSVIETRAIPVGEVNNTWGTNFSGEELDLFELNNNMFISNTSGRSNYTKIIHAKKHDYLLVIERYEKPSKQFPNGKLTIVCKDTLLYDGDMPYINGKYNTRTYPFIKQISLKQLSSFWGGSIIERCIPLQRAFNSIKNKKHEYLTRLASGVLTVEDGSVDIDNLENEGLAPGKILIYRNGSTPPKFLEQDNIPEDFEKEENKLLSELNSLASISEVSTNNNIPSGINSGTALTLLIEQDDSRLSLVAEEINNCIKEIGYQILRLYKQFANNIRLNKLTDDNGNLEIFYWKRDDVSCDDIILDIENHLDKTNSSKRTFLLSLLDKGLFYDDNGNIPTSTKKKLLSYIGLDDWISFDNIEEVHQKKAISENFELEKLDDPIEIDDHKIHIEEHTKYIISNSKTINKESTNKLLQHIKKHKQYLERG